METVFEYSLNFYSVLYASFIIVSLQYLMWVYFIFYCSEYIDSDYLINIGFYYLYNKNVGLKRYAGVKEIKECGN